MQEISRDLDRLSARLREVVARAPQMQRALHERLGARLLDDVRHRTPISIRGHHLGHGEYHQRGTLRRWQTKYIGSKGGYAAVRAAEKPKGANGAGAITNYVENGHKTGHAQQGVSQRTRRRWRQMVRPPQAFVSGRGFYHTAEQTADRLLIQAAERWAQEIVEELQR